MSEEEYIATFCNEKRIRNRWAVYVSPETHEALRSVVLMFRSEYHTTTSSFAEAIFNHHFETHKELLNGLLKEDAETIFKRLRQVTDREDEKFENDLSSSAVDGDDETVCP